jgi:hypothetical protein
MEYGAVDQTDFTDMKLMHDATMMQSCGFADMTAIVNQLVPWAYKKKCGITSFTIARACVGKPGIADGRECCTAAACWGHAPHATQLGAQHQQAPQTACLLCRTCC